MNTVLALMAVIVGALASLVAFEVIKLEKFVDPGEAEAWHDKYDCGSNSFDQER